MFEFKTSIHPIPTNQLFLYYLVIFIIYVAFLRKVKLTTLSLVILLLFNQGFIILIDSSNRPSKILFIFFSMVLLLKSKFNNLDRREFRILFLSVLFTILFFMNYIINGISLLWGAYQYYKYFVPIALFFAINGHQMHHNEATYYGKLILKLIMFQVIFSVVKIAVMGIRENIIGSISDLGGGIGIGYAIMGAILYWYMKGKDIKGKDWWFVLSYLMIPIASTKRAIWFIYPIIIIFLMLDKITRLSLRRISYIIIIIPFLIYFGFRLNPSLNPEKKLWGSFDPQYAVDYARSYSGVSEEKLQSSYSEGRWGASMAILNNTFHNPLAKESLLGFGRSRSGKINTDIFDPQDYGIMPGTMISSIGIMIVQMGWPATLLLIILFINIIYTIPDRKTANIIAFYVLWDLIFYSGSMINSPVQSILLIFIIQIIKCLNTTNDTIVKSSFDRNPSFAASYNTIGIQ